MSADDVDVTLQPNAKHLSFNPWVATDCLTLHHFQEADHVTTLIAPHNSDARRYLNHADWPPPLLFDVSYGCAALHAWGVPHFINLLRRETRKIYYEDGENDSDGDNNSDDDDDNKNNGGGGDSSNGSDGSDGGESSDGEVDVEMKSERDVGSAARGKRKREMDPVDMQQRQKRPRRRVDSPED